MTNHLRGCVTCLGVIGALLLTLGLEGCTFTRSQFNAPDFEERVASVVPGKTTVAQLELAAGGPPISITPLGKKQLYAYAFGDSKRKGLTLIILNILKTNTSVDTALFLIDENGIVQEKRIGQNYKHVPWEWWAFDEDEVEGE